MRLSLFGAGPDTGNLGVTALCYATLYNFSCSEPNIEFTVFDHREAGENQKLVINNRCSITYRRQGAYNTRRFYRPECLKTIEFLSNFGFTANDCIKQIRDSAAILDISGGDSFTDLYGPRVFETICLPKRIALKHKRPLILLPQTYGPFNSKDCAKQAAKIVKNAACAWARDKRSFMVLRELLGHSYDEKRHGCGVDVAFGLPIKIPNQIKGGLQDFLSRSGPKIGINISGLIFNNQKKTKSQFGFKADYNLAVIGLITKILTETENLILLVPHVTAPQGHYESDLNACCVVYNQLDDEFKDRVYIAPLFSNPCEIKWLISQMDWFCATRMHAAIAALSSAVPVSAISYSPKTLGVFESCGQGEHVADPVKLNSHDVVEILWKSWKYKDRAKQVYQKKLPHVRSTLEGQIQATLNYIKGQ